jgi:hypothetical protein
MAKKKEKSPKKSRRIAVYSKLSEEDTPPQKILIENFVALQKVMTHLSERFDNLSTQISKILNLFEISAKALAEKDFKLERDDREVKQTIERLDGIIEQNKILARGLTLLHEGNYTQNKQETPQETPQEIPREVPQEIPQFQRILPPAPRTNISSERYQRSMISSEEDSSQDPSKFKNIQR